MRRERESLLELLVDEREIARHQLHIDRLELLLLILRDGRTQLVHAGRDLLNGGVNATDVRAYSDLYLCHFWHSECVLDSFIVASLHRARTNEKGPAMRAFRAAIEPH
ncbi:hypothetical protein A8H39_10805 [Paraburkholderia fungorum]|nr:hypothetical protein A8H39_10805 [Paraburkholderia fungorum]